MFQKVKSVKPLDNYILLITFENNIQKKYDIKPLLKKWDVFKNLINNPKLYENVTVDNGGYGIYWNEYIDLSCNELWNNGVEIDNRLQNS